MKFFIKNREVRSEEFWFAANGAGMFRGACVIKKRIDEATGDEVWQLLNPISTPEKKHAQAGGIEE